MLRNNVEHIIRKRKNEQKKDESRQAQMSIRNIGDRINPDAVKFVGANALEETILGLLLIYEEYRAAVTKGSVSLVADDFVTAFGKKVFSTLFEVYNSSDEFLPAMLGQYFTADEMGRLEKMRQSRLSLTENGRDVLDASIAALKAEKEKKLSAEGGDKFATLRAKQEKLKNQRK